MLLVFIAPDCRAISRPFLKIAIGGYTYDFIELFAPHLTRNVMNKAMKSSI